MDIFGQIISEISKVAKGSGGGYSPSWSSGSLPMIENLTKSLPADILPNSLLRGSGPIAILLIFLVIFPIFRMFFSPLLFLSGSILQSMCLVAVTVIQFATTILVSAIELLRIAVINLTQLMRRPSIVMVILLAIGVISLNYTSPLPASYGWISTTISRVAAALLLAWLPQHRRVYASISKTA